MVEQRAGERSRVGLCAQCRHGQAVHSAKGSTFWRCGAHDFDPSWPKYPRLPVLECGRYQRQADREDRE